MFLCSSLLSASKHSDVCGVHDLTMLLMERKFTSREKAWFITNKKLYTAVFWK